MNKVHIMKNCFHDKFENVLPTRKNVLMGTSFEMLKANIC